MDTHRERMEKFQNAGLYFVTSESLSEGRSTLDIVRCALVAGVKLIQLREKYMPLHKYISLAQSVRELTQPYDCLLIINDRIDVALAVGADGVHLGLDDFPIDAARSIGKDLIIGASSHTIEEAEAAEKSGASYLNIGPIYPTQTKNWTEEYLGIDGLKEISQHVTIPFTVMGGIKQDNIADLCAAGAETIALVTAVTAASNPEQAARDLLDEIKCHRIS
jgi:thiamine-phosphate pyrophosphorylase